MNVIASQQRGFSLVEVLVAIAILAGLMTALAPTLNITARTASRIHENAQFEEDTRTTGRFLRDVISQTIWLNKEGDEAPIAGEARRLQITTLDPEAKSPMTISLTIEQGQPQTLTAQFAKSDAIDDERYIILSNMSNARFQYLKLNEGNAQWRNRWHDSAPPALIRFTGNIRYGDEERAFVFEVPPKSAAPLHCAFDPVSRQCR